GKRSTSGAAKFYGIPRSTLKDRVLGYVPVEKRMGPSTFLTDAEEEVIVNHIVSAQKRALPVTKDTVMSLVNSLLSDERYTLEINQDRPYQFGRRGSLLPGEMW
ncbi:unnamed protein product, partial [Rotaria socialis]